MCHTIRSADTEQRQAKPHRSARRAKALMKRRHHRLDRRSAKAEIRVAVMDQQGEG